MRLSSQSFTRLESGKNLIASLGLTTGLILGLDHRLAIAQLPPQPLAQTPLVGQVTTPATQLFVNPNSGNDSSDGTPQAPFRTITQALQVASSNTVIVLAPGTYSPETGENFPILLKPGITLQGDPPSKGRNTIIRGGGFFLSRFFARQNITLLAVNNSGVAGVTVTNPNRRGYGIWIESSNPVITDNTFVSNSHDGISVNGNSAALIRNNYFAQNGANGITIYGSSRPEIRDNVFTQTGFGINIGQNSAPLLMGNLITQNKDGVVVQGKARPVLRGNRIEANSRDGLVAIAETLPDLGTRQQPGGNLFNNNGRYAINVIALKQTIPAFGNQLARDRTTGSLDLAGTLTLVSSTPSSEMQVPRTIPNSQLSNSNPSRSIFNPVTPPPSTLPSNTQTNAILIPVPPPQSGTNSSPRTPRTGILPNLGVQPGLLPVPDGRIPLGNPGNQPPVRVYQRQPRPYSATTTTNRAEALGFHYRVVVQVKNKAQLRRVRSLVPGAFRTRSNGKIVMQVGAYPDREQADAMLQTMLNHGLNATLEEL